MTTDTERALAELMGDDDTNELLEEDRSTTVDSLTILPGTDKSGFRKGFTELTFRTGDVVCVVGPTGSGKSRLLADIEWLARFDTPTRRGILINDSEPDLAGRYAGTGRLVAQLSQNMNFVMDATVGEFLELHAESRGADLSANRRERIIAEANRLTGEPVTTDRQLTELSGGQSRALMIADTALLSTSPIVLIDEIENAGIDRHAAITLLRGADKIVLVATHDPSLALSAERRLVIANGGIVEVRERTVAEEQVAERLRTFDALQEELRRAIRGGETLDRFRDDPWLR
ncbi:MAG: ATP-binding cassette domain-containing protein [Alkalispirochaeta sp.]